MKNLKDIVSDILYVSKLTKTKNKKLLIISSILLSQLSAGIDLIIIASFASFVASQLTNIEIVNFAIDVIDKYKIILVLLVISRYFVAYIQAMILKKIELSATISLRVYLFAKMLQQKNFSTGDQYYYINTLSGHIAYFYSNVAQFLNHFLQAIAYTYYLVISDTELVSFLGIAVIILGFPIRKLILASRNYTHKQFQYGLDANNELVNTLENLSLIKMLRMEKQEEKTFSDVLKKIYYVVYKNYQVQFFNGQLPNFFTLTAFAIMLNISRLAGRLTLDILGVTVRLFGSLSNVTTSFNQVVNAQVHIKEFIKLEKITVIKNSDFHTLVDSNKIELKNINFKYFNSDTFIFENLNLEIQKDTHNIIVGPNGSGKSTLLGIIGNVLRPETGKLLTFSNKFAYIGATPYIFHTTLRNNIVYGNSRNLDDQEITAVLKRFKLFSEEESYDLDRVVENTSLSSGQMQKIAFIRAILSDPDVLLLDESMANLDETSKELVLNIVSDQKITVINSTHDPEKYKKVDSLIRLDIVDEKRVIEVIK
jgi:ABC-type multidrug transport system fused ATPase/permease subunit